MPEKKRNLLPYIILIGLLLVGGGVYLFSKYKTTPAAEQPQPVTTEPDTTETTEENLTNLDPSTFDAKLKENLDLATALALKWKPDSVLVYAQVQLDTLTPDEGTETYAFDSRAASAWHFTVSIDQKTKKYIRAAVPTEDYLGANLSPIDPQYWKINYVSALQIAEKEGGKEFRDKNLNWTIETKLKRGEPNNWLFWIVEYSTKSGAALSVKINPFSSEVVKETEPSTQ